MIDLPDSATFAAALADRRIFAAMAVAALAGLTRGFSGFGGAMIYMPLIAAIYDPRIAAVTILLVDFVSATPFAIPEVRRCTWREVAPLSVAMAVGPAVRHLGADRARPDRAALVHRRGGAEPACRSWRRAGAITARRACRSPSASACSPA